MFLPYCLVHVSSVNGLHGALPLLVTRRNETMVLTFSTLIGATVPLSGWDRSVPGLVLGLASVGGDARNPEVERGAQ
jgi:hypothetical protein